MLEVVLKMVAEVSRDSENGDGTSMIWVSDAWMRTLDNAVI